MFKIPKIRSYISLVSGFFILIAIFSLVQLAMLHFGFINKIMPSYYREKQEMVLDIKADILREAHRDPHFSLKTYLSRRNAQQKWVKVGFMPKHIFLERRKWMSSSGHKPEKESAVPLRFQKTNGYLFLRSGRFYQLSSFVNIISLLMLAALIPSLFWGITLIRIVYRKTTQLTEAAEKISRGDYQTRIPVSGNDEFSLISQAFNKMAASIEQSTLELKNMDLQRRQFIVEISHELATPLTAIKGYVETLQMEEFKPSETEEQQYLHIIEEETERLTYLIHDLLEIARMDAGTLSIEPHSIDCREFLTDFTGRNELQLKKRGISLTWNARPGQTIFADHRRLEQIFQNLLDNTMKHSTGAAGILIEVTDESAQTVITFSDNGTGIPTSQLNRIFDRYYSTTPEIPVQGVSGLGLAIVKGLIELHHGTITVSSSQQGTSFCIRLPQ